jgi:hypothetical protein
MKVEEAKRLKELEKENARLKKRRVPVGAPLRVVALMALTRNY